MNRIVGIGEVVWDVLPDGNHLGGAPINFTYYANALGAKGIPVSAVGADMLGDKAVSEISSLGLDVSCIQRNELPTSRVLVTLDGRGGPQYEIVEGVAWDAIKCTPESLDAVSDADAICWGSLAQRSAVSKKSILSLVDSAPEECMKVFDINIRQHFYDADTLIGSLRRCNVLKLNEDELPLLCGMLGLPCGDDEGTAALCSRFSIDEVILTKGGDCSKIYSRSRLVSSIPTPPHKMGDTVGAGDSFTASYVAARLDGMDIVQAHGLAVKVAAYVCSCRGAIVKNINQLIYK